MQECAEKGVLQKVFFFLQMRLHYATKNCYLPPLLFRNYWLVAELSTQWVLSSEAVLSKQYSARFLHAHHRTLQW